jgi:hypothetical protein
MFVSCECLCCQVEASATGRSLVQRSRIDCGVCECDQVKINNLDSYCEEVEEVRTTKRNNPIHVCSKSFFLFSLSQSHQLTCMNHEAPQAYNILNREPCSYNRSRNFLVRFAFK